MKIKHAITLLLIISLGLTACGSKEAAKTEEELREELKAEIKAELQEEVKQEQAATVKDDNKQEGKDKSQNEATLDIKSKEEITDFIIKEYDLKNVKREDIINNLVFIYEDFDNDDRQDVACYSDGLNYFYEVAFITLKNGQFTTIKGFEEVGQYGHDIRKEGDFLVYRTTGGGTGISRENLVIYRYLDGEFQQIGEPLTMDGHTAIPPSDGLPEGRTIMHEGNITDMSRKVGQEDDLWLYFSYRYTERDYETNEILFETRDRYMYDENMKTFIVSQEADPIVSEHYDGGNVVPENSGYAIERIKPGMILENFYVENAYYAKLDEALFVLTGDVTMEGRFMENEVNGGYCFTSEESMFKYPIMLEDIPVYGPAFAYFDSKYIENLPEWAKKQLKETKELSVRVSFNRFEGAYKWGSEGGEFINITNCQVLDSAPVENNLDNLAQYGKETLYNVGEPINIDYSKYSLVIIPAQDSVHTSKLEQKVINMTQTGKEFPMQVTILGELESLVFTYIENPFGEEGTVETKTMNGPIGNVVVKVNAFLPSDFSSIGVVATFKSNGVTQSVEFSLDDMRDPESHEIFLIE